MKNTQHLQSEAMKLMGFSMMSAREKSIWAFLIPNMPEDKLTQLRDSLAKEVSAMTDLALKQKTA